MAIEIIGKESDVKRYREILHARGENTKAVGKNKYSVSQIYKKDDLLEEKPDGYRLLKGRLSFSKSHYAKKEFDPTTDRLWIKGVANANIVDRVDERINPQGLEAKNFLKNKVLLVDHMYFTRCIVGRVEELTVDDAGVGFDAFIGDPKAGPLTETQRDIRSLVLQGLVQTVSIGFIPKKIKAPEWDDERKMTEPAVIEQWELLELSIVAVPCNPDATFEMRNYAKKWLSLNDSTNNAHDNLTSDNSKDNNNNIVLNQSNEINKKAESTIIQTLIFDKEKFTVETAKKWALDHDFKADSVDETDDSIRLRQCDPDDFDPDSFRTIEIDDGIKAVIGKLKEGKDMELLEQIAEDVKELKTALHDFDAKLQKMAEIGETTLSTIQSNIKKPEEKPMDEKPEDEKPEDEKPEDEKPMDEEEDEKSKKVDTQISDLSTKIEQLTIIVERLVLKAE